MSILYFIPKSSLENRATKPNFINARFQPNIEIQLQPNMEVLFWVINFQMNQFIATFYCKSSADNDLMILSFPVYSLGASYLRVLILGNEVLSLSDQLQDQKDAFTKSLNIKSRYTLKELLNGFSGIEY